MMARRDKQPGPEYLAAIEALYRQTVTPSGKPEAVS